MKFLTTWFMLLLFMLLLPAMAMAQSPAIQLYLNGKQLTPEVAPRIVDGNTIVPVRVIAESIGSKVSWDAAQRKVSVERGATSIQLFIDKKSAVVNGKTQPLEAAPVIIDGNTMLPLRFVVEQLDTQVSWDELTKSVFMYKKDAGTTSAVAQGSIEKPVSAQPVVQEEPIKAGAAPASVVKEQATVKPAVSAKPAENKLPPLPNSLYSLSITKDGLTVKTSNAQLQPPKIFRLSNPERIVIDIAGLDLGPGLPGLVGDKPEGVLDVNGEFISKLRYSLYSKENSTVRIVLDLTKQVNYTYVPSEKPGEFSVKINEKSSNYIVYIDPGHGDKDSGAVSKETGRFEKTLVLAVGQKVAELLGKEKAVQVVMTRSDDTFLKLSERVALANHAGADLFVSIHANSNPNSSAGGTETYYNKEQSVSFAQTMHAEVVAATGFLDRGVKFGDFHVIRETHMPSVLIEIGFISNPAEENKMFEEDFQNRTAASIVKGIKKQLNLE